MFTGKNTIFTSGTFNGECKFNGTEANNKTLFNLTIGILDILSIISTEMNATSKVANFANSLFNNTDKISYSLTKEFISGHSDTRKYIVANQFDHSVSLDETNHYIMFSGFASTINSEKTANQVTNCVVQWSYNMCYKNKILDNGFYTIKQTINYFANMK